MNAYVCTRCRRHTLRAPLCAGCRAQDLARLLPPHALLRALLVGLAPVLSACEMISAPEFEPTVPTQLVISAPAYGYVSLAAGLTSVFATDRRGRPLRGIRITATADNGGSTRALWSTTDSAGLALFMWRLGPATGTQVLTVSADGTRLSNLALVAEPAPLADLTVSDVSPANEAGLNPNYKYVAYSVCFCGIYDDRRGLWADVDIFLSRDRNFDATDLRVTDWREHILAAGQRKSLVLGIQRDVTVGWWYPIVRINANSLIPEPTFANNISVASTPILFGQ